MCFSHCADVFEAWAAALASPNAALRWFGRGPHAVWRMAKWRFRHCLRRNGRRYECYWWLMHVFLFPAQWYCMVKLKVKNGLNRMSSECLRDAFGMPSECLRNVFGCLRDAFGMLSGLLYGIVFVNLKRRIRFSGFLMTFWMRQYDHCGSELNCRLPIA